MSRFSRIAAAFALIAFGLPANTTQAATATSNFNVLASVGTSCTIAVLADLNFGAYDPTNVATDTDATTTMNVTCTSGTPAWVNINEGSNKSATSTPDAPDRRLSDGNGNYLSYGLYQDAPGGAPWGTGLTTRALTGTGTQQTFTIYGRLFRGQTVPNGSYADPVVASIDF